MSLLSPDFSTAFTPIIIIVDVAVDHNVGVMADMGTDVGLVVAAVVGVELEMLVNTGGEAVGTEAAGFAVGETVGLAVVCGTVGEAGRTAELGLEVGEPVGMVVVADRVEVAVGHCVLREPTFVLL